jgi:transposase
MENIYVGIDVSKNKFDTYIKNEQNEMLMKARTYEQSKDGMERFIKDLKKITNQNNIMIGLEASGIYHRNLMHYLLEHDFGVREFNPLEISALRKGRIRKTKTDKIDAEVIADAVRWDLKTNTERYLSDEKYLKMKEMSSVYNRVVSKITGLKIEVQQSLSSLCPGYGAFFKDILSSTSVEILKRSMKQTRLFQISEKEIRKILDKNYPNETDTRKLAHDIKETFNNSTCPDYAKEALVTDVKFILMQYDTLKKQKQQIEKKIKRSVKKINPESLSIPGVGEITCSIILGSLGNVKRFRDGKAITGYAGLDPIVTQSGKSVNRTGHISKRGNKYLRTALINAALVGIRYNPVLKARYHHLRGKGKSHLVALVACARKLLLIIYSVEKNGKRFYVPSYVDNQ